MRLAWRRALPLVPALAICVLLPLSLALSRRSREQPLLNGSTGKAAIGTPEACASLAGDYRDAWRSHGVCSVDADCMIEARGGVWFELDGCSRVTSRIASPTRAEATAQQWMELGCAHDYETCPPPGRVGCRFGHCAELPPTHVPEAWKRVDMGSVLTFFVPPEMVAQPAAGDDSIVRALASPRAALVADLGEWSSPLRIERHPDADSEEPEWALITEQELVVAGVKGRRVAARNVFASACAPSERCRFGWRYQIGLHVADVPYAGPPTVVLQRPKLTIVVMCDVFADCLTADSIFASVSWW